MANGHSMTTIPPLRLLINVWLLQSWRRLCAVTQQSRLLVGLIGAFIMGYLLIAFLLFYRGLQFANSFPGLGTLLTERLMFLMFAFLFLLLLISNLVIGYSNLFRNQETSYLLSLPIPTHTIFHWKFIESTMLASWAFLFLIAPLLAAYGLVRQAPWHFYAVTPVFLFLFILLPGIAGSFAAVMMARYFDRRSFQVSVLLVLALVLISIPLLSQPQHFSDEQLEARVYNVLDQMLSNTRFVQFPLLPSYWLSAGVLNWADGARTAAVFFGLVLLSHVLFFGLLLFTRMGQPFYEGASAVNSRGGMFGTGGWFRRKPARPVEFDYPRGWLDRLVALAWFTNPATRALLVKDIRTFWRDTSQWAQTLILFGLLTLYIINLRHFTQNANNQFWIFLISLLNLGACSLNLATLTTRFVYPQFSLEGKRIWIVGMSPVGLHRVGDNEVLAGLLCRADRDADVDHQLLPHVAAASGAHALFLGVHRRHDLHAHRHGGRVGRALPEFQRGESEQDRERLRRYVLPRDEFPLHRQLGGPAGGRFALAVHRRRGAAAIHHDWRRSLPADLAAAGRGAAVAGLAPLAQC